MLLPCSDENITLLKDGNFGLYPLVQNSSHSFTDPRWFDLMPVQSIAAHTEPLAVLGGTLSKSKISILAFALQVNKSPLRQLYVKVYMTHEHSYGDSSM